MESNVGRQRLCRRCRQAAMFIMSVVEAMALDGRARGGDGIMIIMVYVYLWLSHAHDVCV